MLLAVQQIGQHRAVGGIGGGDDHRVDQLAAAVDAKMSLDAEVSLVLLSLMHLGIARLVGILGRRRRIDDRGIDDRTGRNLQPFGREMTLHLIKQPPAQIVRLEQMAEAAHRRLVWRRLVAKVDADKTPHRQRTIQPLFHRREATGPAPDRVRVQPR